MHFLEGAHRRYAKQQTNDGYPDLQSWRAGGNLWTMTWGQLTDAIPRIQFPGWVICGPLQKDDHGALQDEVGYVDGDWGAAPKGYPPCWASSGWSALAGSKVDIDDCVGPTHGWGTQVTDRADLDMAATQAALARTTLPGAAMGKPADAPAAPASSQTAAHGDAPGAQRRVLGARSATVSSRTVTRRTEVHGEPQDAVDDPDITADPPARAAGRHAARLFQKPWWRTDSWREPRAPTGPIWERSPSLTNGPAWRTTKAKVSSRSTRQSTMPN